MASRRVPLGHYLPYLRFRYYALHLNVCLQMTSQEAFFMAGSWYSEVSFALCWPRDSKSSKSGSCIFRFVSIASNL